MYTHIGEDFASDGRILFVLSRRAHQPSKLNSLDKRQRALVTVNQSKARHNYFGQDEPGKLGGGGGGKRGCTVAPAAPGDLFIGLKASRTPLAAIAMSFFVSKPCVHLAGTLRARFFWSRAQRMESESEHNLIVISAPTFAVCIGFLS